MSIFLKATSEEWWLYGFPEPLIFINDSKQLVINSKLLLKKTSPPIGYLYIEQILSTIHSHQGALLPCRRWIHKKLHGRRDPDINGTVLYSILIMLMFQSMSETFAASEIFRSLYKLLIPSQKTVDAPSGESNTVT